MGSEMGTDRRAEQVHAASSGGRKVAGCLVLVAVVAGLLVGGCAQNELGRYSGYYRWVVDNPKRVRNPIVKSENYWIQKEIVPEEQFPGPTPEDLMAPKSDYILGAGDLVDVSILELMAPGQAYGTRQRISQMGQISLPYVGTVKCAGLTARGLEEKLADLLEPDYLSDPQVSVFVAEYRNLNVSFLSGVSRPGLYPMTNQDMALLELVAMAGGILQLVEDYGYVIREYSPDEADLLMLESGLPPEEKGGAAPAEKAGEPPAAEAPEGAAPAPQGATESGAVRPKKEETAPGKGAGSTEAVEAMLQRMAEGEMPEVAKIEEAEATAPPPEAAPMPAEAMALDEEKLGHWVWSDGKWVEVKSEKPSAPETPEVAEAAEKPKEAAPVDESRLQLERKLQRLGIVQGSGQLKRIVRFDVQALQAGDPTQNVVLRDGDVITIPSPPMGDFYMTGEVARPGVYSLTGRKITLLQAVAAAGGLTAIAVPWRTEVVRRIAEGEEEIIYVDISRVARGEVPDFYIRPEDLIRVGSDQGAIYNAVIRNAFRATYGFGFVYDMNFADFYPWTDRMRPIFDQLF